MPPENEAQLTRGEIAIGLRILSPIRSGSRVCAQPVAQLVDRPSMTTTSRAHAGHGMRYPVNAEGAERRLGPPHPAERRPAGMAKEHVQGHAEETATPSTRMDRIAQGVGSPVPRAAPDHERHPPGPRPRRRARWPRSELPRGDGRADRSARPSARSPATTPRSRRRTRSEVVHVGPSAPSTSPAAGDVPRTTSACRLAGRGDERPRSWKVDPLAMAAQPRRKRIRSMKLRRARHDPDARKRTGMSREDFRVEAGGRAPTRKIRRSARASDAYVYATNHAKQELPALDARPDREAIEDHRALACPSAPGLRLSGHLRQRGRGPTNQCRSSFHQFSCVAPVVAACGPTGGAAPATTADEADVVPLRRRRC